MLRFQNMKNPSSLFSRFLNESRALLLLSFPIIISQLAIQGMNFVDITMAGQASAVDLAAIAVGGSLWMPVSLLLRGILMALTPVIAHHRGRGVSREITRDLGQALWIALLEQLLRRYEQHPCANDHFYSRAAGEYCLLGYCLAIRLYIGNDGYHHSCNGAGRILGWSDYWSDDSRYLPGKPTYVGCSQVTC